MFVMIHKKKARMELAQYFHVVCFSPVQSTFIKAITNSHLKSCPELTPTIISKYLPTSIVTVHEHLHQENQSLKSTKTKDVKKASMIDIRHHFNGLKEKKAPEQLLEDLLLAEIDESCFPRSPIQTQKPMMYHTWLLIGTNCVLHTQT